MAHRDIQLEDKSLNGVYRFRFTIKKDDVAWNGIDSVTLIFKKPNRTTQIQRVASLEDDAAGIWNYTTVVSDLDTVGYWTVTIEVVDATLTLRYPYEIAFKVTGEP